MDKAVSEAYRKACIEIADRVIKTRPEDKDEISAIKKMVSKKYALSSIPGDAEILKQIEDDGNLDSEEYKKLKKLLRIKPVRTLSGVAVVSVMTSPSPCPHGKCIPCPGGIEKGTPQSYTGLEPAAQRGLQYGFDAYKQVSARLNELKSIGHEVDKVEIIVMGGTFPARDSEYKKEFMLGVFNALNTFRKRFRIERDIQAARKKNEKAKARCTGITFETRPDYARKGHILEMLGFGGTKVELGVQNTYDDVLRRINRGHTVKDVIEVTKLLKDSALKVGYHMMPGLPDSDFKKDVQMFREIFYNADFKPDYLKIYPTLVVEGTELFEMWKRGEYKPYSTEEVVELIASVKRFFPEWVRVQRIQRDIPVKSAIGLEKGNIRQLIQRKLKDYGYSCRCIRCREVGHKGVENFDAELVVRKYSASDGTEYFISYEIPDYDALAGFIRLRFPHKPFIKPIENTALIRELHVYGEAIPVGMRDRNAFQHKGMGEKLLSHAEEIAGQEFDRIAVISGTGVRNYYRKFGYRKNFEYMVKKLK